MTTLKSSRKQLITMMKADKNLRLMIISSRRQLRANMKDELTNEKKSKITSELKKLVDELGEENVTYADVAAITNDTADIDVQLQLLAISDDNDDCEMQRINVELQALSAEEEELNKAEDKDIKNTYGIFAGK